MTKIFSELISGIFGHNGHAQEPLDKVTFDKAKKRLSSSAKIATKELDAFTQMIADMRGEIPYRAKQREKHK
jgi:hypothetical protein